MFVPIRPCVKRVSYGDDGNKLINYRQYVCHVPGKSVCCIYAIRPFNSNINFISINFHAGIHTIFIKAKI